MSKRLIRIHEQDDRYALTGRSAAFDGIEFIPLHYADLIDQKLSDKITIHLAWHNADVVESTIPEIRVGQSVSGSTTLASTFTSKGIGLVKGGWLPAGLAVQADMIVLPDRCIITALKGRFAGGVKRDEGDKDFLDFFAGPGIRINPLLFALEGNRRRNPTPQLIREQLNEVNAAVKSALPESELVPPDTRSLQGILGIVQDTQASMERQQRFLMQMARKLRAPTSVRKKDLLWDEVLTTAQDYDIPKQSLVVLAVLSSISVPNGRSPAKRLLKFTGAHYSMEDAYNALADLRSLEVLLGLLALPPDQRLMLCTGDKNLALFWAGLQATDLAWDGVHAHYKISPEDALLPSITPAQRDSFVYGPG